MASLEQSIPLPEESQQGQLVSDAARWLGRAVARSGILLAVAALWETAPRVGLVEARVPAAALRGAGDRVAAPPERAAPEPHQGEPVALSRRLHARDLGGRAARARDRVVQGRGGRAQSAARGAAQHGGARAPAGVPAAARDRGGLEGRARHLLVHLADPAQHDQRGARGRSAAHQVGAHDGAVAGSSCSARSSCRPRSRRSSWVSAWRARTRCSSSWRRR